MNVSIAGRFSVCLMLGGIGLFFGSVHWLAPHPNVALEMPVSLSPGHVITGNFSVAPDSLYYIDIEFDEPSQVRAPCKPRSVLSTRWVLTSERGKREHGSSPWEDTGLTIADLYSEKQRYAFDVEILPGASCLNAGHPRLKVQTHPYPSDSYVASTLLSVVLFGAGLALLIPPYITWRYAKIEETRMIPDMVLRSVLPITKHKALAPIQGMPHWGLFCGAVLWILIFVFMIFGPQPSNGLFVSWKKRDAVVSEKSPWPDTVAVYIHVPARFFVNSEEVDRNDLRSKLIEQLGRRVEWTVYFEADANTSYMNAVYAIDVIQGSGAKLVWVTPKMREQWRHSSESSPKN